jgi:hypothetical protein
MFKEMHMRSIAQWGLFVAAGVLAGCQINPYTQTQRFTTWSDAEITPHQVRFPIVATFPDETMFFYPIWVDYAPRADLNLRAIGCTRLDNGKLVVTAKVQNMGADIIANTPLLTGDTAAFRVAATVTSADGSTENVTGAQIVPLRVSSTVTLALNATRAYAEDVTRIDVVADPDRVVPDPVRDNNVLTWQGRMSSATTGCTVER